MGFLKSFTGACWLVAASCNNATTTVQSPTNTTETDTVDYALHEDSVKLQLNNTAPPEGFYAVTLPCSNCNGIAHTVLFNRDLSFRLEEQVLGSSDAAIKKIGYWKPVNGDIWLYKADSSVVARYTWHGDTLHYIDLKSGVLLPLRPLQSVLDNPAWKAKKDSGLVFFGTGTEPFWNLAINTRNGIVLTYADGPKPITFKAAKPVATADSTVYQARNDSATLRVVVYNRFGNDGMSDLIYPNRVTVFYKSATLQGSGMLY